MVTQGEKVANYLLPFPSMVEDAERAQLDLGGIEHDKRSTTASNIDIFLRIKPVSHPTNRIVIDPLDGNVEFNIPRNTAAGSVNNSRENYSFSFNGILTPKAKQDEVGCIAVTAGLMKGCWAAKSPHLPDMCVGLRACCSSRDHQCA